MENETHWLEYKYGVLNPTARIMKAVRKILPDLKTIKKTNIMMDGMFIRIEVKKLKE